MQSLVSFGRMAFHRSILMIDTVASSVSSEAPAIYLDT